jgi:hypothetical protein
MCINYFATYSSLCIIPALEAICFPLAANAKGWVGREKLRAPLSLHPIFQTTH